MSHSRGNKSVRCCLCYLKERARLAESLGGIKLSSARPLTGRLMLNIMSAKRARKGRKDVWE